MRIYHLICIVLIAMASSTASAAAHQNSAEESYALQVDYDPRTGMLAGLCKVNGHSCWLTLDTGATGVILFQDQSAAWGPTASLAQSGVSAPKQTDSAHVELIIAPSPSLTFHVAAQLRPSTQSWKTTRGEPIVGVLGTPYLTDGAVEWNIPARTVTFWLHGRPDAFRPEHRSTVVSMRCERDPARRILLPVSVGDQTGRVLFDTGSYDLYLPDAMLRDFPMVGLVEEEAPLGTPMSVVRRQVRGLRIGPMRLSGPIRSILPGSPGSDPPPDYGYLGLRILSLYHLFLNGNTVWIAKN